MPNPKFRVAICGGGIGGLTLAVTLGRYGDIPVDIYESSPEIGTLGAGLAVSKRTWDVMRRLGFENEMKKRGFSVPKEGECLVMLFRRSDQAEPGVDVCRVVAPYNMIPLHRMHLMEMLQALLPTNCTIHTSKRLTTYTRNTDGTLTLHFADGHTAVTDVLVGADGIHSAVRGAVGKDLVESGFLSDGLRSPEALLKSIEPKWTGTVLYRSLIAPEKVRPEHSVWTGEITCYSGKGKHLIAYPVSNGAFINFLAFYTVPGGEGTPFPDKWVAEAPKEDVIAPFEGWESDVQELLQALDTTALRWTPHVMESVPFAAHGRVAILGDAMHAMTTHLSAGAGQAIEDAYLLGRILSHQNTTFETISRALQIYQDIRLAFSQAVVARSREAGLMYEFNGPEYDGADRGDVEALGRWRKGICDRWQFQWNTDPEGQWEEAESKLRAFEASDK
ncbi:FAD/NAD-P-binding domain-containing protein [Dentipellis sp. KUC8613]|nr:FAD/NAD-P-binding domain-containing protein [Dentipellis sp. KUC8613]